MTILLTGIAGFVGYHTAIALKGDHQIIGLDNLNDYYSPALKIERLKLLGITDIPEFGSKTCRENLSFYHGDLTDTDLIQKIFDDHRPDAVVHLAAQAGVRFSLENPAAYIQSNLVGFANILEGCRSTSIKHLLYASSSSVYGNNTKVPFNEDDSVDHPVSLYAATKKSNELMAHTYSHLYGIPTTGVRFFTVYGPLGRPDMAYFKFTRMILEGETLPVFNNGDLYRDFTYIDDITGSLERILEKPPTREESGDRRQAAPYRILNIGNNQPVKLLDFISVLEEILGKTADKEYLPMQPGDVLQTYADIDKLQRLTGYSPKTSIREGLEAFCSWYRGYYNI